MEKDFRLVIWGTGGHAGSIINYNKVWLENVDILCFVNNSHKVGEKEFFYEKPILSPGELLDISYDGILILSTFIKEIREQLTGEMGVSSEYIITLEELAQKIVKQKDISIIEKKVLLYGNKYREYNYIYHLKQRTASTRLLAEDISKTSPEVEKIGFSDMESEIFDYILLLDEGERKEEFVKNAKEKYGVTIKLSKVLEKREWIVSLAYEHYKINNNGSNYFYALIPRPHHGLMALFNEYIRMCGQAYEKGHIPFVDMQNAVNMYLSDEKFGKENAWEYYFEQMGTTGRNVNEIYQQENVIIPSMFAKSSRYRNIPDSKVTRDTMKEIFHKSFAVKKEIIDRINQECSQVLDGIDPRYLVGAVYRGTDYTSIKPANHMIQPEIDEFIEICRRKKADWNCRFLYIATEDADALDKMKEAFGEELVYTNQIRYRNTGGKFLAEIHNDRENDEYWRGYEYLTALVILSRCSHLVAGRNNGVYGAFIIKDEEYEDTYIFDRGKYAVTNPKYL